MGSAMFVGSAMSVRSAKFLGSAMFVGSTEGNSNKQQFLVVHWLL